MLVLTFGAGYIPAFRGDVTINYALYGIKVPLSGHWIPEERPDFVVDQLFKF